MIFSQGGRGFFNTYLGFICWSCYEKNDFTRAWRNFNIDDMGAKRIIKYPQATSPFGFIR